MPPVAANAARSAPAITVGKSPDPRASATEHGGQPNRRMPNRTIADGSAGAVPVERVAGGAQVERRWSADWGG